LPANINRKERRNDALAGFAKTFQFAEDFLYLKSRLFKRLRVAFEDLGIRLRFRFRPGIRQRRHGQAGDSGLYPYSSANSLPRLESFSICAGLLTSGVVNALSPNAALSAAAAPGFHTRLTFFSTSLALGIFEPPTKPMVNRGFERVHEPARLLPHP
jgi:hypothetical protein